MNDNEPMKDKRAFLQKIRKSTVADFPLLVKQWCYEKNGILQPDDVSYGSKKSVWWICENGHQWEDSPGHRTKGRGCPYCSHQRLLPEDSLAVRFPSIAAEWDYERNQGTPSDYAAFSSKKVYWKCQFGHSWQAIISNRAKRMSACPYCSGRIALPGKTDLATLFPEIVKEWHPTKNGNTEPNTLLPGCNKKYWWKCKQGHEWEASPNDRKSGRGCPYCSHRQLLPENSLQCKFPDVAVEWDYERNQGNPSDYAAYSNKEVSWVCRVCGHRWVAPISNRTNVGSGCPVCSNHTIISGFNDLRTINPLLADEWDYDLNDFSPSEVGINSVQKVWWKCALGHSWQAAIHDRNRGTACPVCKRYSKTSLQEYTCY